MEYKNPLISVVIPVYNVEKYLDRCLSTVVNQIYKELDIILVDDGSPDRCPQICDEWEKKDKRIRVIHKKNGGLSSARNAGIDISEGEYITFIDSDDWVSNEYISYLYELITKTNADMAMGSFVKSSVFTEQLLSSQNITEQVIPARDFLLKILKVNTQQNVQYAWGKLYKNFKESNIRYPDGLIDEDVPTTFKYTVLCCNKIAMSTKCIYIYFENMNSILRKQFNRNRFDLLEVWKMIEDFSKENCDDKIIEYTKTNYYRANFGILCNICTEECNPNDLEYIRHRETIALKVVKKHRKELLNFPMPLSRKIFVIGFCICYPISKKILKITGKRA